LSAEGLSPEDQAFLEELARAELLQSEEEIPVNPDPPLVAESSAPTHKRYETAVRSAIGRLWIMTPEAINNFRPGRLVVNATLGRDGNLLRFLIIESSGSASLDHIGLEALRGAAPFPAFPEDMAKFSQWELTLIFDYQAKYTSRPNQ
jgi:TonB family protein